MMGIGGFSPLTGFMTKADWQGVCDKFLMADGTFWPIPVTLSASKDDAAKIKVGEEIALYDPEGKEIMATMKVTEKYDMGVPRKSTSAKKSSWERALRRPRTFGRSPRRTTRASDGHEPEGRQPRRPVKVLSEGEYPKKYAGVYMRPAESARFLKSAGGKKSRPCNAQSHARSHEYLCKIAVEVCDGVFIHSLVGT